MRKESGLYIFFSKLREEFSFSKWREATFCSRTQREVSASSSPRSSYPSRVCYLGCIENVTIAFPESVLRFTVVGMLFPKPSTGTYPMNF